MTSFTTYDSLLVFLATTFGVSVRLIYDSALSNNTHWGQLIKLRVLPIVCYVALFTYLKGDFKYLKFTTITEYISISIIIGMFLSDMFNIILGIFSRKDLPKLVLELILQKLGYQKIINDETQTGESASNNENNESG